MGKEIKQLYYDKGITPPVGRGLHTMAFHRLASGMIAEGTDKNIAYATAMSKLGRDKAVNKSHWSDKVKPIVREI